MCAIVFVADMVIMSFGADGIFARLWSVVDIDRGESVDFQFPG